MKWEDLKKEVEEALKQHFFTAKEEGKWRLGFKMPDRAIHIDVDGHPQVKTLPGQSGELRVEFNQAKVGEDDAIQVVFGHFIENNTLGEYEEVFTDPETFITILMEVFRV